MPHLSPMQWTMTLMIMWILILMISSTFWWSQSSKFHSKKITSSTQISSHKWNWL